MSSSGKGRRTKSGAFNLKAGTAPEAAPPLAATAATAPMTVLLGPQQGELTVGRQMRELGILGDGDSGGARVALVTAGWQEREGEDEALVAALGVPAVNLKLHARTELVFAKDAELASAWKARQQLLRHLQDFYRVRLDHFDDAAHAIAVRHVEPELLEQEEKVSLDQLRHLDQDHLERCRAIHKGFEERWRPGEREVVARHRAEIRAGLEGARALVIAGGHVASLFNRMQLFDVTGMISGVHVVAWSAGAMILTDRIVLFHDYPPYGKDIAQVLDAGFGLAPGVVVLPDPRRRIRMDDKKPISRFAHRMAPLTCVPMDVGSQVVFQNGQLIRASAERMTPEGEVERGWRGAHS